MSKRLLSFKGVRPHPDFGLLVLRLMIFIPLFLKHGTEKLFTFHAMAAHFPNPIHIGPVPTLVIAMISDGICSLLLVLGLASRWAALWIFFNIGTAWALVHHFVFFGRQGGSGELLVLYMAAALTIFFAGPGKYSIDGMLGR